MRSMHKSIEIMTMSVVRRVEVAPFFDMREQEGSQPGGVHLELTGQSVTECIGGAQTATFDDLDYIISNYAVQHRSSLARNISEVITSAGHAADFDGMAWHGHS